MTTYHQSLRLLDFKIIVFVHLINDAINKSKEDHSAGNLHVSYFWELGFNKLKIAELSFLSSNNLSESDNSIFITPID